MYMFNIYAYIYGELTEAQCSNIQKKERLSSLEITFFKFMFSCCKFFLNLHAPSACYFAAEHLNFPNERQ